MTLQPGTTLGRYQILEPLGQGGMASVYRAFQPALDRVVALKILHPSHASDPEFRQRFEREAKAVARLRHPHIVQVFDFDQVDGRALLAMEYLAGGTLKAKFAELRAAGQTLPPREVGRIVAETADALAYAHSLGIVHRDVKPSNIMLTRDGRVVVTDFGIAKMVSAAEQTRTGVGIGTPEYMSPEQAQGAAVDARSDIYSLGVVAFELLAGRVPFVGDTPLAVVHAQVFDSLPSPSTVNPRIGPATEAVLLRALAKDPAARFARADAFAAALSSALDEEARPTAVTIGAGLGPPPPRRRLALPRRPLALAFAAGAVLVAAVAAVLLPRPGGGQALSVEAAADTASAQVDDGGSARAVTVTVFYANNTDAALTDLAVIVRAPGPGVRVLGNPEVLPNGDLRFPQGDLGPHRRATAGVGFVFTTPGTRDLGVFVRSAEAPEVAAPPLRVTAASPTGAASAASAAPTGSPPGTSAAQSPAAEPPPAVEPTATSAHAAAPAPPPAPATSPATPLPSPTPTAAPTLAKGGLWWRAALNGTASDVGAVYPSSDATAQAVTYAPGSIQIATYKAGGSASVQFAMPGIATYVGELDLAITPGSDVTVRWGLRWAIPGKLAVLAQVDAATQTTELVTFNATSGTLVVQQITPTIAVAGLQTGRTFTLSVVVRDTRYTLYLDGVQVADVSSTAVPSSPTIQEIDVFGGTHGTVRMLGARTYLLPPP